MERDAAQAAADDATLWGCLTRHQARCFLGAIWAANAFLSLANFLMAAGQTLPYGILNHQLNMSDEVCLGSWYPSILLFLLGLAALRHFVSERNPGGAEDPFVRYGWLALAALAALLSADEVANLHEGLRRFVHVVVRGRAVELNAIWSLLLSPVVAAVALFLWVFCLRALRDSPRARRLALGGLAAWIVAIAAEIGWRTIMYASAVPGKALLAPLEESAELFGTTLLLMALVELGFCRSAKRFAGAPPAAQAAPQSG
ncbi:MAG: hypothetical protein HY321_14145 [Armatimonadetes bacterium]|nr:hypothetical protein [Armatimonadota bacterium]